jgi:cephalosporin hydroxylase
MGRASSHMTQAFRRAVNWRPRLPVQLDADRSALRRSDLRSIQSGTLRYTFRDVPCLKNPFDLALYTMLLNQLRPTTIVEVGSASGGSALWFASQARGLGLACRVLSVDIDPVTAVSDPDVVFVEGDVHDLSDTDLPSLLKDHTGPLLVIEDGPHTFSGSLAALQFFDGYTQPGDYIVVEDGIANDLGYRHLHNGPNRAVRQFLANCDNRYVVDRHYCDFYGRNVTWNPNGYLRRVDPNAAGTHPRTVIGGGMGPGS